MAVALSALAALAGTDRAVVDRLRRKLDGALGGVDVRVRVEEPPLLDVVRRAAEDGERLRIRYVDLDDVVTERDVDPLKVFVDRGHSYVYTDDHLRGAERVFRVDRIVEAGPTGVRFTPRPVTPPAGSSWEWMVPDREVVVRLPPGAEAELDRTATLAHIVEDDGSVVAWLSVVSEAWLASLLVRCGPGAEVLDPPELVDVARRRCARQLARAARR